MTIQTAELISTSWRDYYELTKPRVVMLMILTSVIGMLLAVPGMVPLDILLLGNIGMHFVPVVPQRLTIWLIGILTQKWHGPVTVR